MELLRTILVSLLVLVLLPVAIAVWLLRPFWGAWLRMWFWRAHGRHGRVMVLVYSQSPLWKAYIEESWLPRLGGRAVVLDWSERRQWNRRSFWAGRVFEHWAGSREFNPMAIVFENAWRVSRVRFFRAFKDRKRGREDALRQAEARLFRAVGGDGIS